VFRDRSHIVLVGKAQSEWSAQENAGHLLDLEPLWLARVGDYVAARDQLTVADLKNRKTDEANHNVRPLEQILSEFRAATEVLLKRVDELDASLFARAIPHPRLKTPMRLVDHLYLVAEHDDHHLARISGSKLKNPACRRISPFHSSPVATRLPPDRNPPESRLCPPARPGVTK
jgi:hypothetical protein